MSDLNFTELNLTKVNVSTKTFTFNDKEIEVVQYLPSNYKYDIIMTTLQKAEERGIYNPYKLDVYFHLNLVYLYTNLVFTKEDREDELKLYDILESNGIIEQVINLIPEDDYNQMLNYIQETYAMIMKYRNTAGAILQSFIQDLPKNAEAAAQVVDNFDPDKFKGLATLVQQLNPNKVIAATK
jgi:hypothetical protein